MTFFIQTFFYTNISLILFKIIYSTYRDANGLDVWYECISVIEHSGLLSSGGDSAGHYLCDVKDANSGNWFRTNDSTLPKQINSTDVFKKGYAYLLKRNAHLILF